jgi:hypothetical protein
MQTSRTGSPTTWKQAYEDALLELDPRLLQPKLQAAQRAVEDRLLELRSDGDSNHREVLKLTDAQHTLRYLQEHEQQT